ncbi:hypothetical protein JYG35_12900 [Pseudomonas rhodesiae]|jgi:uncharacterized membrane protein|uniref:hypothetical protein n=1 Tax=Pseudomonas TaxID=286 RepID=UPI001BD0C885|nr:MULTISPECIES: hypothetical protein [Pseudomonas]QVN09526.1 hypothetical protein JYG35_12900 [Pseudomonas rhodesiae]
MKGILINLIFALVASVMPALIMAVMTDSRVIGLIAYICCLGFFFDVGRPKADRGENWQ